jgi:hypothetical protein
MSSRRLPQIVLHWPDSGSGSEHFDVSKPWGIRLMPDGEGELETADMLASGVWSFRGDRILFSIQTVVRSSAGSPDDNTSMSSHINCRTCLRRIPDCGPDLLYVVCGNCLTPNRLR